MLLAVILTLLLTACLLLAVPVGFSLLAAGAATIAWVGDIPLMAVPQQVVGGVDNLLLLAIPFFLLAGDLMNSGGITQRLLDFTNALVGRFRGGLALSNVASATVMSGISGSAVADTSALGRVLIPAMVKEGYSRGFAAALTAAANIVGPIIPPSITFVLIGVLTNLSITKLFLAGVVPGVLYSVAMAITAYTISRRRGYPVHAGASLAEVGRAFRAAFWALLMPVLILGGIYSGLFTATESASIAVVYALVIELFVYRKLDGRGLLRVTTETTRLLGALFPVLMMALALNKFLTFEQVPAQMVAQLEQVFDGPGSFILATNALLLVVGCLMDIGSAILILAPILQPVAEAQGMQPVHFGIMMTVNLEIGYLTPPMGLNLIVAMTAFRENFWFICKAVLPFIGLMLVGLAAVALWPALSLFMLA